MTTAGRADGGEDRVHCGPTLARAHRRDRAATADRERLARYQAEHAAADPNDDQARADRLARLGVVFFTSATPAGTAEADRLEYAVAVRGITARHRRHLVMLAELHDDATPATGEADHDELAELYATTTRRRARADEQRPPGRLVARPVMAHGPPMTSSTDHRACDRWHHCRTSARVTPHPYMPGRPPP